MSTIRNKLFGLSTAPVSKPVISKPSGNMAILPKMAQPVETLPKNNSAKPTAASVSGTSSTHIPISILNGNREQVPQQNRVQGSNFSGDARIPISIVNGDREQVSQQNRIQVSNASTGAHIPISIVNGDRDLTSHLSTSEDDGAGSGQKPSSSQTPYMPISGETVSKDNTTVSPQMSAYMQQGSPSAAVTIPKEYADLANLLDKASSDIDFNNWADLTAKQQLSIAQKADLSVKDKQTLLNASPQYVETIAKVQDIFANRYELGLTIADTRTIAKKLFNIADEKDEATNRTGKYANDAVFAPRALRYLDEQEKELLEGIGRKTNKYGYDTWYNGGNPDLAERAARRDSYADIDDAQATKQIEEMLMKNIAAAEKIAALSESDGSGLAAESAQMLWFYQHVKQDAPMDYKNPIIWKKSLPGLPFPEEDKVYRVFGYDISSSDLGNLNYALVGRTLGIPETLLLQQAGAAQLEKDLKLDKINSQIESIKQSNKGYGDEEDDQDMITNGFDVYNHLF